ncbi:MAG: hypothetical protein AAGG11_15645 [Pseudomonadota bacterium]
MDTLIILSLLLNIAVLVPVCTGIIADAAWAQAGYGSVTPARSILLSIYLTIGVLSVALLVVRDSEFVAALLLVQVIYKVTTPVTVGTLKNPVVISNLLIAAVHGVTLASIWRSI